MKVTRSKRCRLALALAVVLLSALGTTVAASGAPEWTIDIAQQLLAEGWEEQNLPNDVAVVGYAIHFVELERSQARSLGIDFHIETQDGPGLWEVASTQDRLALRLDTSSHNFTANLQHNLGHKNEEAILHSWLLTTEGQPLKVDISSTNLTRSTNEYTEDRLAITILPTSLQPDGMIESDVSLTYETMAGSMAKLHTTTLVGPQAQEPIAVVSREIKVGRRVEYQYFAVYLAGMQIPSELIPKDTSLIPMGSIVGLQEFMEDVPKQRPVEILLGVSYHDGSVGFAVDGSIPVGHKHRLYGELNSLPQGIYRFGVEGSINPELHFVAELGSLGDGTPSLRLGLRDELQLGEELYLSAVVLPIRFTMASPKPKMTVNWRLQAEYSRENYSLVYKVDNDLDRIRHNVGVVFLKTSSLGARLSLSWDEVNRSVVAVGIELRF